MKFLYVGDLHQYELVPVNRIDDFNETRREKISEITRIAKDNNVKAILHGGDFFNRPKMSNEFITSVIESWNDKLIPIDIQELTFQFQSGIISDKEYLDEINKYKINTIPFISIIGNHDLIGENLESYPKTSLNVLETSGFLHIVDKENPIVFKEDGISVAITGTHYNRELDKGDDKDGYIVREKVKVDGKDCDYQIHLTHGMLTPTSYGKKFAHTLITSIQDETFADLTINGHDHVGFDTVYHDNKIFANPGSPFRLSANKNEMGRMPKVMLVNIDENGLSVQDVYLKCAKKGEEVLSDEAKRKAANEASAMAKIQTLINQSSMKKGLRIADVIENIGNVSNIDKDVVKDVQNRIIESMNVMQPPFHPSGEYYITRVELENFLSHKNSAFDFTPGLNILSGESRSGKSAVLRALREVMTCYIPQPRKAIFFSASYFAITVYTSNGYIVKRKVERDEKKGFNGYEIYDPTTGVNTSYNTKAVSIVQEILGYSRIPLTEKKFIDVNSVIQGDGWFFVGNGISAPDKARLLGVVYGTHYADAANKEIASEIKKTNAQISLVQKEKERLDDKMREYAYLPKLEQDINDAESLLEVLEKQEEALASMKELYNKAQPLANEIAALKKNLAALSLDNAKAYAMALKEKGNTLNLAKEKFNNLTNIVVQGRTFRPVQRALTNIQTLQNDCNGLKVLEKELLEEKEKYNKYVSLNQQSTLILNEKARLSKASEALVPLQEAKLLSEELSQQKQVLVKFKEDATKAIDKNNQLANLNKTMERDKGVLKAFENMPSLNDLKALSNQKDVLSKAKEKQVELDKVLKEKELQTLEYSKAKKKNLDYIEEYKKQLEELGTCPICHSSIDADLVNHLVASHLAKVNS